MAGNLSPAVEAKLAAQIASYFDDPYGFVMFAYPWGQPTLPDGSENPLANKKGPELWQKDLLLALGDHIRVNSLLTYAKLDKLVARFARSSGHGVGKSALVAWLIQFFMSTRKDCRGAVTANTATQLETRTWPELAKWQNILINKHWFTWTATTYYFTAYSEERRKNYMFTAATVSEHNVEAFQGLHNESSAVVIIFDEASGIFSKLWAVAEGALTDGEGFFFAFGNPTQPDGEFADCFDKHQHVKVKNPDGTEKEISLYNIATIDSRSVSFTNKTHLNDIIRKYGEDHDETRIRVYGKFPRQSYNGFISHEVLRGAIERELIYDSMAPLIMAVDVARYGPDSTVIRYRQGRDARTRKPITLHGKSAVQVADVIEREWRIHRPDAIVIEGTGPGSGVIDILRDRKYKVFEVSPGSPSGDPEHYYRKRDELWGKCRDWLLEEGCIDDEKALIEQMGKIQYTLDRFEQKIKIENKEDFKVRTGLSSPDEADSLVLSFGVSIARRDRNLDVKRGRDRNDTIHEYDALAY
jgi:hypothetical protein